MPDTLYTSILKDQYSYLLRVEVISAMIPLDSEADLIYLCNKLFVTFEFVVGKDLLLY
jgi:hypothetical protein